MSCSSYIGDESDVVMESMFGNKHWKMEKIISEHDLILKHDIIYSLDEVEKHILPFLKQKEISDLKEGKPVDFVVYESDSEKYFYLKLILFLLEVDF